jgi:hypothetical protein
MYETRKVEATRTEKLSYSKQCFSPNLFKKYLPLVEYNLCQLLQDPNRAQKKISIEFLLNTIPEITIENLHNRPKNVVNTPSFGIRGPLSKKPPCHWIHVKFYDFIYSEFHLRDIRRLIKVRPPLEASEFVTIWQGEEQETPPSLDPNAWEPLWLGESSEGTKPHIAQQKEKSHLIEDDEEDPTAHMPGAFPRASYRY